MSNTPHRAAWALVVGAGLLVACGEKPQTATKRQADDKPWTLANGQYAAPGFKPGDAGSWEQQLKVRAQGQNEHSRVLPQR